ncbi:DUF3108 domain-containing protein [Flavobacterium hercynium]|uniref:DUF3108 domain-containing protein n=1 Tax=Flavobacterium hercynium TaxID=387094 RepID=A0A226GX83_9FLAO|nr:hypothetical protein [Flavobacterium hercynium]OXA85900.1 hypothetical protein B0A66_18770 [Flavobacterium hercynium]SMP33756.1 hypothetical protein SAMN06265346_11739 [Flavobacterium hercynium]
MKSTKPLLLLTAAFSLLFLTSNAQKKAQSPSQNEIIESRIKNEEYEMNWFAVRDTTKMEIGKVFTKISKTKNTLTITTTVKMKNKPDWIDETIAELTKLKAVKHTSVNMQRDIELNFGKQTTGFYLDKIRNKKTEINEETTGDFFDSNLYPQIIRWLPLKENYKTEISIFDYNPMKKTGILKANITNTQKGSYANKSVWIVTVTDDISDNKVINTYYFDSKTNQLLKQEIDMGANKMLFEKVN